MGELRNAILELQKQSVAAAKTGTQLGEQLNDINQRARATSDRLQGGVDVLWLHVKGLLEKNGHTVDSVGGDTLAQHADSDVAKYLKGIDEAVRDLANLIAEHTAIKNQLPAEYKRIDAVIAAIRANLDKKRAKLIQSKKYKAKLAAYEKSLTEITSAVADRRGALVKFKTVKPIVVTSLTIKPNSTIRVLDEQCTAGVQAGLTNMKADVESGAWVSRRFRENGDLKAAFETLKQWSNEADAMDQEVINLDPSAAKPLKDVKLFAGNKLIASAPKALYQGKRPMEVPAVKWEKGVNVLSLLQQKVTLRGTFDSGDGGQFANDMKINGVKDTTLKLI